jgi:hypothetical protein
MKFWKKKQAQVERAVDDVAVTATELAEKTLTIGPGGVLLMLGAAAVGAAATHYVAQTRKKKKAARESSGQASEAKPSSVRPKK